MLQMGQILTDVDGWQHMTGWDWGWMALGYLFWLAVVVLVAWGVTQIRSLAERFAQRERSPEEFTEQRAALRRAYGRRERWHVQST